MSRVPVLTDSLLREALVPARDVMPPHGLLAAIADGIRATPQVRRPLRVPWLDRVADLGRAVSPDWSPRDRRLALVMALVALLVAVLAGALVGAGLLGPHRTPLRPTGLVAITGGRTLVDRVVVDGRGSTWAVADGRLTRFDSSTGERQSWTAADDVTFSGSIIAPAGAGGVWVLAGGVVRRFDGQGFLDEIPVVATDPMELVAAPDGTLWLASADLGLQRWDGARWVSPPAGRPTNDVGVPLLALGPGDIWVENPGPGQRGEEGPMSLGVSHLVDGTWVNYGAGDAPQLAGSIGAIERAADGSIWVTVDASTSGIDPGIARFDGSSWSAIDGPRVPAWWLEAGDDGSMWAITSGPDGAAAVARWRDGAWREFGAADGVASTELGNVAVTPAGTFLGTNPDLLRFAGDRWVPAWPDAGGSGPGPTVGQMGKLAAVSAHEAWAADAAGLWHWIDGEWAGPVVPDGHEGAVIAMVALGPDGALWVATDRGVARLRDGRWATASDRPATLLAVGADGTAWAAGGAASIERLAPAGDGFDVRGIDCPLTPFSLAVATDGSVYAGDIGFSTKTPGLARSDGRTCEWVDIAPGGPDPAVVGLVPDPAGGVVGEVMEWLPDASVGGVQGAWHGRIVRVDGTRVAELVDEGLIQGSMRVRLVDAAGRIWRTPYDRYWGVEAFDGAGWTWLLEEINVGGSLSMAPDGTVYLGGTSDLYRWIPESGVPATAAP